MTTQEALDLVDQAVKRYVGTRADHALLQEAMTILTTHYAPTPDKKEDHA